MAKKTRSRAQSKAKSTAKTTAKTKQVVRRVVRRPAALALSKRTEVVRRRRVVEAEPPPKPAVDTIVTETDVVTEPKVEIRRAGTLSQALTEPAVAVVKPETKVLRRAVKTKRSRAA